MQRKSADQLSKQEVKKLLFGKDNVEVDLDLVRKKRSEIVAGRRKKVGYLKTTLLITALISLGLRLVYRQLPQTLVLLPLSFPDHGPRCCIGTTEDALGDIQGSEPW